MPLYLSVAVRHAADSYAVEGEKYSSSFDQVHIFWQTPTDTYDVAWATIDRAVCKVGVTILTLKSSRAICVLPNELLTTQARARLDEIDRRRLESS